jgi:predicted nucleotidyltransferase
MKISIDIYSGCDIIDLSSIILGNIIMSNTDNKIIFDGIFGSKLYGTENENSDTDYKGVFMPSVYNTVLGNFSDSIETQDVYVDKSMYAISKFIRMLEKADTVSIDMLHTPADYILKTSPLWEELYGMRKLVYSKNMRGIVGYIKTQSSKYGHKVQRLQEMKEFLNHLDMYKSYNTVQDLALTFDFSKYKFISYTPTKVESGRNIIGNIDVCGSRYQNSSGIEYMKFGIESKVNRYGKRSEKGSVEGGDWKSLSHAYRVLLQLDEIINTRDLRFPLKRADEIRRIKNGELEQDVVMFMIDQMYKSVMNDLYNSDLPDESDLQPMKDAVVKHFIKLVN